MSTVVLCNLSDVNKVTEELRLEWINDVLDTLDVPDEVFEAKDINSYRAEMEELGIEILLYSSGEVDVYKKTWVEGNTEFNTGYLPPKKINLVAQWKLPERVRRIDGNEVYYELHLNEWSITNMRIR